MRNKKEKIYIIKEEGFTYMINRDLKSIQNSFISVEVCDEETYISEPVGELIPEEQTRHKCD